MGGRYGYMRSCTAGSYGAKKPAQTTVPCSAPRARSHLVRARCVFIGRFSLSVFGDPPKKEVNRRTNFLRPGKMSRKGYLRSLRIDRAPEWAPTIPAPDPASSSHLQ